jgi:hypothetical protein
MMQSLLQLGFLTYYSLNVDSIEAQYCVNKDKPEMCCKGKCYISKQINTSSDAQSSNTLNNENSVPDFEVSSICKVNTPDVLSLSIFGNYKNSYASLYVSDKLRPPSMI